MLYTHKQPFSTAFPQGGCSPPVSFPAPEAQETLAPDPGRSTSTTQDWRSLESSLDTDSRQTRVPWQHCHLLAMHSTQPASGGEASVSEKSSHGFHLHGLFSSVGEGKHRCWQRAVGETERACPDLPRSPWQAGHCPTCWTPPCFPSSPTSTPILWRQGASPREDSTSRST